MNEKRARELVDQLNSETTGAYAEELPNGQFRVVERAARKDGGEDIRVHGGGPRDSEHLRTSTH